MNYREQSSGAGAYLPVAALPKERKVVLAQCESRLEVARFQELLAAGMGGDGQRVHTRRALQAALARAAATRGRFQLIEIMIPRGVLSQTLDRYVAGVRRLSSGA